MASGVGVSPYASVQSLSRDFRLIHPAQLRGALAEYGFQQAWETQRHLPGGKAFRMAVFEASAT